jgi:uncharacterized protein YecE (DUF72 family)
MTWHLGTMGFSYKDWEGPFYPPGLPARNYLSHYSRYFNAVEIDSTFYGTPRPETVLRWKHSVPDGFKFCLKTPREITHELRLKTPQAADSMVQFVEVVRNLGGRLGVILIQLPPSFDVSSRPDLASFLSFLDRRLRFAVEFRHSSWHKEETASLLKEAGVSLASTEYPDLPGHTLWTTPHLYLRWIGQHGRFKVHDRERVDPTENLKSWKDRLLASLDASQQVFGFFNNDYAGFAPASCNRFKTLLGLPAKSFEPPRQGRLFK